MPLNAAEAQNLSKRFAGSHVLSDVSISVPKGSVFGILGPNGAGKTTLLRTLLGLLEPDNGETNLLGETNPRDRLRNVGYLPEERGLYKGMSALESIIYFARLKGMQKKEARDRALELLTKFGLEVVAKNKIKTFSKGMAQKVQILAAIAHRPELLVLDEPFSGLDPVNQEVLEDLIRSEIQSGHTVIMSTHVMQHAERLCDRILLLAEGRAIFTGTVDEAKEKLPRRITLRAKGDLGILAKLKGVTVTGKQETDATEDAIWTFALSSNASLSTFLSHCLNNNIELQDIRVREPSLHDAFVAMVQDARAGS